MAFSGNLLRTNPQAQLGVLAGQLRAASSMATGRGLKCSGPQGVRIEPFATHAPPNCAQLPSGSPLHVLPLAPWGPSPSGLSLAPPPPAPDRASGPLAPAGSPFPRFIILLLSSAPGWCLPHSPPPSLRALTWMAQSRA